MTYTYLSAQYANPQHTAAVAMTVEAAAVLLSQADTPAEWAAMLAAVTPAAYVAPPAPAPRWTPLQFIERFTEAEQIAIVTAAQSTPALRLWYDKAMAADEIVADDPRTVSGMDALIAVGLISAARKAEILSA